MEATEECLLKNSSPDSLLYLVQYRNCDDNTENYIASQDTETYQP